MQANEILASLYESIDPVTSLKYLKTSNAIKDSLYSKAKINQVNSFTYNDQLRKIDAIAAEKAASNKLKISSLFGVMFTLLITGFLLWRNNQHKKESNILLQKEKQTVEKTLENLKYAQDQLIKAEKMA